MELKCDIIISPRPPFYSVAKYKAFVFVKGTSLNADISEAFSEMVNREARELVEEMRKDYEQKKKEFDERLKVYSHIRELILEKDPPAMVCER